MLAVSPGNRGSAISVSGEGLDISAIRYDEKTIFVLAANDTVAGFYSSYPAPHGSLHADGNANVVEWTYAPQGAEQGTLLIAGQQFEIRDGSVVLISLKQQAPKIEVFPADVSDICSPGVERRFRLLADKTPRIKAFLEEK
ncbi:MAG TPA: hypothetical protein VFE62_12730 [Gemmataceae bacterium]|nr:hypothetical protein [Gemmataceae bacterium]